MYVVEFKTPAHDMPEHYVTQTLKGAQNLLKELIDSEDKESIKDFWWGKIIPAHYMNE